MSGLHACLHEADWGAMKANVLIILRQIKDIKTHDKEIARLQVWSYVQWVAIGGMFIWNLRLHGLW